MFWPYTSEFKHNLRDKLHISEIIDTSVTSEDMKNTPPESRVRFCMNSMSSVFQGNTRVHITNKVWYYTSMCGIAVNQFLIMLGTQWDIFIASSCLLKTDTSYEKQIKNNLGNPRGFLEKECLLHLSVYSDDQRSSVIIYSSPEFPSAIMYHKYI